jgi:hypothetical protein
MAGAACSSWPSLRSSVSPALGLIRLKTSAIVGLVASFKNQQHETNLVMISSIPLKAPPQTNYAEKLQTQPRQLH